VAKDKQYNNQDDDQVHGLEQAFHINLLEHSPVHLRLATGATE
jgi:hypothetical protein